MLNIKHINPQYITNTEGEKTAVILPIEVFDAILEEIEDLIAIAERLDEETITHEELIMELKRDEIL